MNLLNSAKLGIGSYSYYFSSTARGRVAFVDARFPNDQPWSIERFVDRAVELGVSYVQLADNYGLDELDESRLVEAGAYAREKGIILEAGMRGLTLQRCGHYMRIASLLGAEKLRCVIDHGTYEPSLKEVHAVIRDLIPELQRLNIILGIENHDRISADEFREIMERADSPYVSMVIDTVNSFSKMESTVKIMETLAPYAVELHIKDYTIERRKDAQGLVIKGAIAGQGRLDIPYVLDMMKKHARSDFSTILEFWMEPEQDLPSCMAKENEWVEKSVAYLKSVI